jgi:LCP family protein required for cell wall assembly
MHNYRINLIDGIKLNENDSKNQESFSFLKIKKILLYLFLFILIFCLLFLVNPLITSPGIISSLGKVSFWKNISQITFSQGKILKGETNDRINILIFGMGGAKHEGPYLTDTIILVSLKPSSKEAILFSIPRDLAVPTKEFGWQRINNLNTLGMFKTKDGAIYASQVISEIFEIPIHYWFKIDFSTFKEFIDWLNGIEIEVERSFTDYMYPGPNFSYQTVSFKAGKQIMNGERALQFVRSRHGDNNEGNDFARMKRQQKVILAIANKIKKEKILKSPFKLLEIYNKFANKVSTNLNFAEAYHLVKILNNFDLNKVKTYTFEAGTAESLLYPTTGLNGAYLLKPKSGNFKEMAEIIKNAFSILK